MTTINQQDLSDSDVTLELLKNSDDNTKVRPLLDFLRLGLKEPRRNAENAITITNNDDGSIVCEYEDIYRTDSPERRTFTIENGDLCYAAVWIYVCSRKMANDLWDTDDAIRLPTHSHAESRLLDLAMLCKRYAECSVWKTIVNCVKSYKENSYALHNNLDYFYRSNVEQMLQHNTVFAGYPSAVHQKPAARLFHELLNSKEAPMRLDFIVEFFAALCHTSNRISNFFMQEREATLGETISYTEG